MGKSVTPKKGAGKKARAASPGKGSSKLEDDYDFNDDPPTSPTPSKTSDRDNEEDTKNMDGVGDTNSENEAGDSEQEEENSSEEEDFAQDKPPTKRRKMLKTATTDAKVASILYKELNQLMRYKNDADRITRFTNIRSNVGAITMEGKFVVVIHSATHHMADLGEESDDEHHNQTVGHSGATGVAVHIPHNALGKKEKLKGVDANTVVQFYEDLDNYKKFLVVDDATDGQKHTYSDVPLFPFIPSTFLEWLLEKNRTPFEFYTHILMFIRNIEDASLAAKCEGVCEHLLQWCLCSCQKAKKNSAAPLTKLSQPIRAIMSPTSSCANSLAARWNSTRGNKSHSQQGVTGGTKTSEAMEMAATAAASAADTSAKMLTILQQQQQYGQKSAAAKEDSGWSDYRWQQMCGYCGVKNRNEVPEFIDQFLEEKEVTDATGLLVSEMHAIAALMGEKLTPFHISASRVKEFRKGIFATGQAATLTDLKSGIVILDLVERTRAEIASIQSQETQERSSERNRSMDESQAIAYRQKQNVGAVPDNVPEAKQTLTHYVVFIRALFGERCPHYLAVFRAKELVDGWGKESATPEMIKNLFWAIIVDARQFFKVWHTEPTSKLDFILSTYEAEQYTPLVSLPAAWRSAAGGSSGELPGTRSGGISGGSDTDREETQNPRRREAAAKLAKNEDVHPLIADMMKPYHAVFKRHTMTALCKAAGRNVQELPKLRAKSGPAADKDGCVNFALGYCRMAEGGKTCRHRHNAKREIPIADVKQLCAMLKPGIDVMVKEKEKYAKFLGLQE